MKRSVLLAFAVLLVAATPSPRVFVEDGPHRAELSAELAEELKAAQIAPSAGEAELIVSLDRRSSQLVLTARAKSGGVLVERLLDRTRITVRSPARANTATSTSRRRGSSSARPA